MRVLSQLKKRFFRKQQFTEPPEFEKFEYKEARHVLCFNGDNLSGNAFVLFHGGGWFSGRPRDVEHWVAYLKPHAATVYLVEYNVFSLHERSIDASFDDCTDALKWVSNTAESKSNKGIIVIGFSAGAASAFVAAMRTSCDIVHSLIMISPVTDLSADGFKCAMVPARGRIDLSPQHILESGKTAGFSCTILHGIRDNVVSIQQSRSFVDIWKKTQTQQVTLIELDDEGHGFHRKTTGLARAIAELDDQVFEHL